MTIPPSDDFGPDFIRRLINGDPAAREAFVLNISPPMERYLRSRAASTGFRDSTQAGIAQTVFRRVLFRLDQVRLGEATLKDQAMEGLDGLRGFVFGILKNCILDLQRARGQGPGLEPLGPDLAGHGGAGETVPIDEEAMDRFYLAARVKTVINSLSPKQVAVVPASAGPDAEAAATRRALQAIALYRITLPDPHRGLSPAVSDVVVSLGLADLVDENEVVNHDRVYSMRSRVREVVKRQLSDELRRWFGIDEGQGDTAKRLHIPTGIHENKAFDEFIGYYFHLPVEDMREEQTA